MYIKPNLYYLNLDERPDRRKEIESEIPKLALHICSAIRVAGKLTPENGMAGCTAAHIKAISHFLFESDSESALIVEDDLKITASQAELGDAFYLFRDKGDKIDCLLLAYSIRAGVHVSPNLIRVFASFGCAGYLINRKFGYRILHSFIDSHELVNSHITSIPRNTVNALWGNDVLWSTLQAIYQVYAINPRIGVQRKSFSNIQQETTDYGV